MNKPTAQDIEMTRHLLGYLRNDFAGARMASIPILQLTEALATVINAAAEKVTE